MGYDIRFEVEVQTSRGWQLAECPLPPDDRNYPLHARLLHLFGCTWWPMDCSSMPRSEDQHLASATLAELLTVDWRPDDTERDGTGRYDPEGLMRFAAWLRSPEVTALVDRHGPEGVRVLVGVY